MTPLGNPVFTKVYSYTDCLALEAFYDGTLHDALTFLAKDAAGIESGLWSIITITMEGYRVELFKEEE